MKAITFALILMAIMPGRVSAAAVQMHDVPGAAVARIETAIPALKQVSARPGLHLVWQVSTYARLRSQLSAPAVVLMAYPGQVLLREQDMALYWAPTLSQQLQLAIQLRPGLRRVGVLITPTTQSLLADLRRSSQAQGISLEVLNIKDEINTRELALLIQSVDLLLAVPDEQLFSAVNAKLLLLPAYRLQRPWLGPNAAFVNAGAAATLQVPRDTIVQAIADTLQHWQQHGRLPASRQLSADEVLVNAPVLRSLGLRMPANAISTGGQP